MGSADQATNLIFTNSFQKYFSVKNKTNFLLAKYFFFSVEKIKTNITRKKIGENKTRRFIV